MIHTAEEFLTRIREEPDADAPRLVYADWLDENGRPERAELIRLQCEFPTLIEVDQRCPFIKEYQRPEPGTVQAERWRWGVCECRGCVLTRRVYQIVKKNENEWRKGPVCEKCRGDGWTVNFPLYGTTETKTTCKSCYGTGDAGGLSAPVRVDDAHVVCGWCYAIQPATWFQVNNSLQLTGVNCGSCGRDVGQRIVDYVRGMTRIHATLAECVKEDHTTGITTHTHHVPSDRLRAALTHHPDVVEVWVTDRAPSTNETMRGKPVTGFYLYSDRSDSPDPVHVIPEFLCDLLGVPCQVDSFAIGADRMYRFDTEAAARIAVARAVVRWARRHLENPWNTPPKTS